MRAPEVKETRIETERLGFHALTAGNPGDPPVVLLHGFPELSDSWREVLPALAEAGFHAVAPDLRGYGRTDKPLEGYDAASLALDIATLIDTLGGQAHVVGHDWGGMVAYHLAARHPEKVDALAVVNSPHPAVMSRKLWQPAQLRKSWYIFAFQLPWFPEWFFSRDNARGVRGVLKGSAVRKERLTKERLAPYAEAFGSPAALRGPLAYYRHAFRSFFSRDHRGAMSKLPLIQARFLLVWGEEDFALVKELAEGMEPHFTQPIERVFLPEVGHFVQLEAPERLHPLLVAHFRGS